LEKEGCGEAGLAWLW
jgi:hypothetical protein